MRLLLVSKVARMQLMSSKVAKLLFMLLIVRLVGLSRVREMSPALGLVSQLMFLAMFIVNVSRMRVLIWCLISFLPFENMVLALTLNGMMRAIVKVALGMTAE